MVSSFVACAIAGGDWNDMVDITALGLQSRQMFIITSNVESREMKEAKVYCESQHEYTVYSPIAILIKGDWEKASRQTRCTETGDNDGS